MFQLKSQNFLMKPLRKKASIHMKRNEGCEKNVEITAKAVKNQNEHWKIEQANKAHNALDVGVYMSRVLYRAT